MKLYVAIAPWSQASLSLGMALWHWSHTQERLRMILVVIGHKHLGLLCFKVGSRCECVMKYTFTTVDVFSANKTVCLIIENFVQSLIVLDSHFNSVPYQWWMLLREWSLVQTLCWHRQTYCQQLLLHRHCRGIWNTWYLALILLPFAHTLVRQGCLLARWTSTP